MRRGAAWALTALVAGGAAGCGGYARLAAVETSPEAVDAHAIVDALANGNPGGIRGRLDARLLTPALEGTLAQMTALFPKTAPTRERIVGFQSNTVDVVGGHKTETVDVLFESNYAAANLLSEIVFQRVDDGERRVVGLHAQPLPAPFHVLNAFTLRGKGAQHYLFLLLMIGVAGVTLAALVAWERAGRAVHRRWWWLLGIVVGAFKITLNWTTGAIAVQAITVQVLSLGFARSGVDGPVALTLSLPVGAVAFLILRRRASLPSAEPVEPGPGPPAID